MQRIELRTQRAILNKLSVNNNDDVQEKQTDEGNSGLVVCVHFAGSCIYNDALPLLPSARSEQPRSGRGRTDTRPPTSASPIVSFSVQKVAEVLYLLPELVVLALSGTKLS